MTKPLIVHQQVSIQGITLICCISYMLIAKIPDPLLGPKGVRVLLFTRGFSGSVSVHLFPRQPLTSSPSTYSFFGLFGVYYSLQFLSLSDATVLTYVSSQYRTSSVQTNDRIV